MRSRIIAAFVLGALLTIGVPALADHIFTDVPDDHAHAEGIEWSWMNGLVQGYEDGTYRPGEPLRRGQIATMLMRQNAYNGPHISMTPDCGSTEMVVYDHNNRGSGPATVEYSVDGGDRTEIEEAIDPETGLVFDAEDEGVVSLFVDGIAWAHAPTAADCTPPAEE